MSSPDKTKILLASAAGLTVGAAIFYYFNSLNSSKVQAEKATSKNGKTGSPSEPDWSKKSAEDIKFQGNLNFSNGKYAKALKFYTLALDKYKAETTGNLGTDLANSNLAIVCAQHPKAVEIAKLHQNIGAVYDKQKKFLDCLKNCLQAVKFDKNYVKAWERIVKILKKDYALSKINTFYSEFEILVMLSACLIFYTKCYDGAFEEEGDSQGQANKNPLKNVKISQESKMNMIQDSHLISEKSRIILTKLSQSTALNVYNKKVIGQLPSYKYIKDWLLTFTSLESCEFYQVLTMKLSTDSDPDYEYFKNLNHNISNLQILNKSKKIIEIIFKFLESRHELVGTLIDSLFGSNENIVKDLEFSDLKKKSETDPSDAQDPVSAEPVPVISDLESVSSASEILTTTEKVFLNILIAISNSHLARFEVANLFYQRANQLDNNNADVYYQLAQYQIGLDQSELALSNFKMAYTKSGENFGKAYAYICYLEFLKSLKMPSSSPNSNLNSKKSSEKDLQDAIQDGDPVSPREQAIAKFAEGEKRFPNTTELFCLHAQALESLQKFEAAIEMYDLCSQKDSEDDQAILYKARLLHNLGKSQACIQICENIILKSGILNENYMSQMEAEIQQQKTKSLAEASAASPKQQKIIQEGLDDKLEKLKQYKQQSQAGKKFVKSNSLDFTYEILATVYTDLDKNSQAIICYEHAITYCNNKMDIYKYFVQMFMLKVKSEVYNQFDLSG